MQHFRLISTKHNVAKCIIKRPLSCTANAPNILTSGLPDVDIPKLRVEEAVFENLSKWENHTALECSVTGRKYSYRELYTKSKHLNKALRKKLKLQKGDVVAILLPNIPEYSVATLGILKAGLTVTSINPIYTPNEIGRQLANSSAKAVITLSDFCQNVKNSLNEIKANIPVLTVNSQKNQPTPAGAINFSEFTENELDIPDVTGLSTDDIAFLPYSSGTTGLPKGVQLTHSNIASNIMQLQLPEIEINLPASENHQDVVPAVLPMFHIYGFTVVSMLQMRYGAKIVTLPRFTPELYTQVLKTQKPHILFLAPPLVHFLNINPNIQKEDFGSIRTVVCGAAPLGASDEIKLLQKAEKNIQVLQGYGLTESSPCLTFSRVNENREKVMGSIGKPLRNTIVKIVALDDESQRALGPNEKGELWARGPQIMKGYHNNPEETTKTLVDGWLRTGDMAYYNENGCLFIADRLKELIKVKGYQVAPAELEELIRTIPDVADAAVIGVPHPSYGEVPRAYVVPKSGKTLEADRIKGIMSEKLASYKQPKGGIAIVDSVPKSATGKILRRELKLRYEREGK